MPLPDLTPFEWMLAGGAALSLGVAKTGVAGLGLVHVVIFAHLLTAKPASGFVLPLLICADVVAVASYRQHAEWRQLWRLFPWTALGVALGWAAMGLIDNHQANKLIGALVLTLLLLHVGKKLHAQSVSKDRPRPAAILAEVGPREQSTHGAWFAPTMGVCAGFATLVANAAGPLMAGYFLARGLPKLVFVGTGAVFFLVLNLFKVPFMAQLGLITSQSLVGNAVLLPAVFVGAALGRWLLPRIRQDVFEWLALAFSTVAGLKLLLG
jgi:uncharacterized protein